MKKIEIIGISNFQGYRKLEEDLNLVSSINFIMARKNITLADRDKKK